ncbi:3-oxoacyl-[acyl-carrier-protein] synthase 3 [Grimontia celer]|uniref:3-oxoacyl-[acyl-carrier-protein] synthase 3 n=1 Tax=Grimontia celer TaxID=1796497 RepID=A0A128F265_9GAMM|nr:3-oxoacyl-[acyl-carrier-protein] synthase III C-terminal domain-containing protein [Grimontia celer]CZF80892.1 3-oxoacyl-[acyl-carrier-protein] synthase 3 [Grimontia celer]
MTSVTMPSKALSIDAIRVIRPEHRLVLIEEHDAVHCSSFNAHILKKMMGIESVNVLPEGTSTDDILLPLVSRSKSVNPSLLRSANTGARRTRFGLSLDRKLARIHNLTPLGSGNANRCVSLFKQLDLLFRTQSEHQVAIHNGELAFSKEMRITRGLSVQGDSSTSLFLTQTDTPKIRVSSVYMHYDRRFSRGIWGEGSETKAYEDSYRSNMHQVIHSALERAGVTLEEVDHILPHNINIKSWRFLCQSLDVAEDKLFARNIQTEGHCFCNDMVINLSDAIEKHRLAGTNPTASAPLRFLAVAAGAGGMFGACVLEVVQLEGFLNERQAI